ncbi:hypothetical protein [Mesorhizobium sp.]|uniref:hypothetical protein n=1 Tax=Mesorhizobium sp. TaxID=1871066 RepID=UPI0025FA6A2D|nr:hypothetical protein [Mesorhizobium sp.]
MFAVPSIPPIFDVSHRRFTRSPSLRVARGELCGRAARTVHHARRADGGDDPAKAERDGVDLKRVAIFQIRSMRFSFLILRMSLSRNRFPLSGDML